MNAKNLVALALLVGMGAVLHAVIPPIFLGMKPDMMLTMMFLGIILFPQARNVMLLAIVTGIISALTTSFPNGQIPNIIDKIVTASIFFGLFLTLGKYRNSIISVGVLTGIGTIISGTVFLSSAYFIFSLPGTFIGLFGLVVLPATLLNTVAIVILYPIAQSVLKRTKFVSSTVIQK